MLYVCLVDLCKNAWFVLAIILLLLIVHQYVIRNWNFFRRQNVRFIRGLPFLGIYDCAIFGKEDLPSTYRRCYDKYPDEKFIGIYEMGGKPTYLIRDPELVRLITTDAFDCFMNHHFQIDAQSDPLFSRSLFLLRDRRWQDMRAILTPAFTGIKTRLLFSLLSDVLHSFYRQLRCELHPGRMTYVCDMKDLVTRFMCDAIGSCSFGLNVNSLKERDNAFYRTANSISTFDYWTTFIFLLFRAVPKLMNFLQVQVFRQADIDYLRKIVNDNIQTRQRNGLVRNDMINLLMEARKSIDNDAQKSVPKWEDDDIVAQCTIFFLVGFYTTSVTICFMLHELVVNPEIQERLYREIAAVQRKLNGDYITLDVLHNMKYMDMVLSETLRKWPPSPANDRQVTQPYTLTATNGNKVQLNVGDTVILPTQGFHMDPKYYPNPVIFDPERFGDEQKANIVAGAYFPFGIGPRKCIASRVAITACKAFVYHLLSQYRLERCAKTEDPIKLKMYSASVEAENGFWMQLKLREYKDSVG